MKIIFSEKISLALLAFLSFCCQSNTALIRGEQLGGVTASQNNEPRARGTTKMPGMDYSAQDPFHNYPDEWTSDDLYRRRKLECLPSNSRRRLDIYHYSRYELMIEPRIMLEKMIEGMIVSIRGDSEETDFKSFYFNMRKLMIGEERISFLPSHSTSRINIFSSVANHFESFELFPKKIPRKGESYNLINCSFNSKSKEEDDDILEFSDDEDVIDEPTRSVVYSRYLSGKVEVSKPGYKLEACLDDEDDDKPVQKEMDKVIHLSGIRLKAINSGDIQKIKNLRSYQKIIKFWIEFQDSFSSFHQLFDILNEQKLKKLVLNGTETTGEGLSAFLLKLPTALFWGNLKTLRCLNLPNEIVIDYLKSLKNLDNFYWRPVDSCNESLPVAAISSVKQLHLCLSQVKETEVNVTIENILKIFPNVEKIKIELNGDFSLSQIPTRTLKEITIKCNKMENESDFMQSLFESELVAGNIYFFNGFVRWRKHKRDIFYQFVFQNCITPSTLIAK